MPIPQLMPKRTMIGPKVTFITSGHPVDPDERRLYLTAIGAKATVRRQW